MAGFNLSGGYGAGGGADMLQQILKQKALEFAQRQQEELALKRLQEDARQADQSTGTARRGQDVTTRGQDLSHELGMGTLGQRTKEFDAEAPDRAATTALKGAQTGDITRRPQAEQAERDFTTGRDATQNKYRLGQIGAENAGQMRVVNARLAGSAGPSESEAYRDERNTRVLDSVKSLKDKVSPYTTGAGSLLSYIPGTAATNFDSELNTLKANIAFNELTEMRAASKTGGALGPVSDKEGKLLESSLGALNTRQSPAAFKTQLEQIEGSIRRWQAAKSGGVPKTGAGSPIRYDMDGNPIKK